MNSTKQLNSGSETRKNLSISNSVLYATKTRVQYTFWSTQACWVSVTSLLSAIDDLSYYPPLGIPLIPTQLPRSARTLRIFSGLQLKRSRRLLSNKRRPLPCGSRYAVPLQQSSVNLEGFCCKYAFLVGGYAASDFLYASLCQHPVFSDVNLSRPGDHVYVEQFDLPLPTDILKYLATS
jgi:hypothetical protein